MNEKFAQDLSPEELFNDGAESAVADFIETEQPTLDELIQSGVNSRADIKERLAHEAENARTGYERDLQLDLLKSIVQPTEGVHTKAPQSKLTTVIVAPEAVAPIVVEPVVYTQAADAEVTPEIAPEAQGTILSTPQTEIPIQLEETVRKPLVESGQLVRERTREIEAVYKSGDTHAGWKLEREIGAGAHKLVYEATKGTIRAALSIPRTADSVAKLREEAQVLGALEGRKHVVELRDYIEGAQPYLATKLAGVNEREAQRADKELNRSERNARALQRIKGYAAGLQEVHDAGYIHRDVKPENLMVDGEETRIADFGITQKKGETQRTAQLNISVTGMTEDNLQERIGGTIGYIAPSILAGQQASERTDIFALGVVSFEAVVGEKPGYANTEKKLKEAGVQDNVSQAILKALGEEYTSASQFLADLEIEQPQNTTNTKPQEKFRAKAARKLNGLWNDLAEGKAGRLAPFLFRGRTQWYVDHGEEDDRLIIKGQVAYEARGELVASEHDGRVHFVDLGTETYKIERKQTLVDRINDYTPVQNERKAVERKMWRDDVTYTLRRSVNGKEEVVKNETGDWGYANCIREVEVDALQLPKEKRGFDAKNKSVLETKVLKLFVTRDIDYRKDELDRSKNTRFDTYKVFSADGRELYSFELSEKVRPEWDRKDERKEPDYRRIRINCPDAPAESGRQFILENFLVTEDGDIMFTAKNQTAKDWKYETVILRAEDEKGKQTKEAPYGKLRQLLFNEFKSTATSTLVRTHKVGGSIVVEYYENPTANGKDGSKALVYVDGELVRNRKEFPIQKDETDTFKIINAHGANGLVLIGRRVYKGKEEIVQAYDDKEPEVIGRVDDELAIRMNNGVYVGKKNIPSHHIVQAQGGLFISESYTKHDKKVETSVTFYRPDGSKESVGTVDGNASIRMKDTGLLEVIAQEEQGNTIVRSLHVDGKKVRSAVLAEIRYDPETGKPYHWEPAVTTYTRKERGQNRTFSNYAIVPVVGTVAMNETAGNYEMSTWSHPDERSMNQNFSKDKFNRDVRQQLQLSDKGKEVLKRQEFSLPIDYKGEHPTPTVF